MKTHVRAAWIIVIGVYLIALVAWLPIVVIFTIFIAFIWALMTLFMEYLL